MAKKRQIPLQDLKEPKTLGELISIAANLEAKLRNFQLESIGGFSEREISTSIGRNKRGEEVEKQTGHVSPLPPAE